MPLILDAVALFRVGSESDPGAAKKRRQKRRNRRDVIEETPEPEHPGKFAGDAKKAVVSVRAFVAPKRGDPGDCSKMPSDAVQCKPLEVVVSDRGIERAIKMLKRKLASEGVLRELKMRRHYMKPSVKRRKKQAEAARRRRKRAKLDAAPPKG